MSRTYIEVAYGTEEGNPEKFKAFRQKNDVRMKLAEAFCLGLRAAGFKEITAYDVTDGGETTRGYWPLGQSGFGEYVGLDG